MKKDETKKHSSTAWQGLIENVCKQPGSTSEKRRGHLDFCAENMCNLRSYVVITLCQHGTNFGR